VRPWLVPARARRKDFAEPPFWALDAFRWPLLSSATSDKERIGNDFEGYVEGAYKGDSVVFGCIDRRQQVFSQAHFQWRERRGGVLGDFFGSPELALLEEPWPNGTTGELLSHMETDASLAGNSYWTTCDDFGRFGLSATGPSRRLVRMRPDWVTIVIDAPSGNPYGLDARVVAYLFEPKVGGAGVNPPVPVTLLPSEVCHYSPKPDPVARFRGMSWLTPILEEITADKAATRHKGRFFRNGATPNMAIKFDKETSPEAFAEFVENFNNAHQGADQAYKTLFLAGGADITPLSIDFKQLDFKATQGAGETRIAVDAGVPAAILGISEGLQGSTLNTGNFGAARRLFVDTTIRDLWNKAAPSLQGLLVRPTPRTVLAVDDRDIPFLREDAKDQADIRARDAETLRALTQAGWGADAAVDFITANDPKRLRGQHSGLFSVQLQPPTTAQPAVGPSLNGRANGNQVGVLGH
jgi:phage portal protein BeeE